MGTIITAATIMAIYLNSTGNVNSQYCYNADMDNGRITTMYVYDRHEGGLSGRLEYRYAYDTEGRVTSKTVMRRGRAGGSMVPECRYDYAYSADGYSLTYSRWDVGRQAFAPAESLTCYRAEADGVVSVSTYELCGEGSEPTLVDNMLALVPADGGMMAGY